MAGIIEKIRESKANDYLFGPKSPDAYIERAVSAAIGATGRGAKRTAVVAGKGIARTIPTVYTAVSRTPEAVSRITHPSIKRVTKETLRHGLLAGATAAAITLATPFAPAAPVVGAWFAGVGGATAAVAQTQKEMRGQA